MRNTLKQKTFSEKVITFKSFQENVKMKKGTTWREERRELHREGTRRHWVQREQGCKESKDSKFKKLN